MTVNWVDEDSFDVIFSVTNRAGVNGGEDNKEFPKTSFTISGLNFNSVGTNVPITGFSFNEDESEPFLNGFVKPDGGAEFVKPILSLSDTLVTAEFEFFASPVVKRWSFHAFRC